MNPDRQQALNYLCAPGDGLWRWAENGAVLVWKDGGTIAFREEIIQIMEWIAPNGLPSFGAIVFLLAACRGKVPKVADIILESTAPLPPNMGRDAEVLSTARKQLKAQLEAALAQLGRVARFPAELNSGIKARCVLAEAVFELAKAERYVEARVVLSGMREPMSDVELTDGERVGVSGSYIRQIHIVAEGLKLHAPESLAMRLRTGLDAVPNEIDATLPTAERARQLIEELSRDREYGAVARAARELMAAVRLPRRLGEREELAIGGLSDITNRGPLDRLLLSELAHDDLTLSVRVALNEALYLRREPPMREPPGTLALLLDSGVRLWGVPRVLATAVALALIAQDKQHREVLAWRASGNQLLPVDLLSRTGLTQHLGALETSAHPGESIPAFGGAVPPGAQNQSVLITHRDALDDPEFRRVLAENPAAPGFVAAVDREGHFELHAMPLARRPAICEADLDLTSMFDGHTGISPIKTEMDPDLPAIIGLSPFPFLLPPASAVDFWTKAADGFIYAVLNDRRLVQFRDQRSGARVLANDLPSGRTLWMDCVEGTVHAIKAGSSQRPARLLSLLLPDGGLRVADLAIGSELVAVHRYGEAVVAIRQHDVRAYALSDGRLLGQAANPHRWVNGRFFRGTSHYYFVVWDGERVKFEPVTVPREYPLPQVAGVFDREGLDGPWLLHTDGDVISTATGEKIPLSMPTGFPPSNYLFTPSRDGHRLHLALQMPGSKWDGFYDLKTGKRRNNSGFRGVAKILDAPPSMPVWNLFRTVESIARLRDGLAICGRKNRWRKLTLNGQSKKLQIQELPAHEQNELQAKLSFAKQARPAKRGCTLQIAECSAGSRVFLDSRGLLHFKSGDPAVPEISLVLSDGEVAGWTSDGCVCGPPFFFDGPYTSEPVRIFEQLLRFLHNL